MFQVLLHESDTSSEDFETANYRNMGSDVGYHQARARIPLIINSPQAVPNSEVILAEDCALD